MLTSEENKDYWSALNDSSYKNVENIDFVSDFSEEYEDYYKAQYARLVEESRIAMYGNSKIS